MNSDLPVLVSFEVHTNLEQQAMMVDIIQETWRSLLVEMPPSVGLDTPLPSPGDLRKKILIKVKYTPPEKAKQAKQDELVDGTSGKDRSSSLSSSGEEDESDAFKQPSSDSTPNKAEPGKSKKKKKKMLDELSQLGIYTRSYHFSSFTQPEAKIPTHVFSLSEGAFLEAHDSSPAHMFHHNKRYLLRAYPKGLRVSSSNLNPAPFWRYGVQIAALNWQRADKSTMLNEGMFAGTGGWVLKPNGYLSRHPHQSEPRPADSPLIGSAVDQPASAVKSTPSETALPATLDPNSYPTYKLNLTITLLCAQDLPLPIDRTSPKSFRPYVKVILHTESLALGASSSGSSTPTSSGTHTPPREHESARQKASALLHRAGNRAVEQLDRSRNGKDDKARTRDKTPRAPKPKLKVRGPTAAETGSSPSFRGAVMRFERVFVDEEALCFVRFKVMDDIGLMRDELAGWACVRLDRLREGYRVVKVFDAAGKPREGRLLLRVEKTWVTEEAGLPLR